MAFHAQDEIEAHVAAGAREAAALRLFRKELRWRTKRADPARQARIERRLEKIDEAMKPLRSHIGRLVWEPLPEELERRLRSVSHALQYERKQLKKMRAA